jgi:hypothetical protein
MKNLIENRKAILKASSRLELYAISQDVCADGSFHYNESQSYADNARSADLQSKHGVADCLRLCEQRSKCL